MNPWRTVSRKILLERKPQLTVEERHVILPDGSEITDWTWLDAPEAVMVVAVDEMGRFVLLERSGYAVRGPIFAPPGGALEPAEEPLRAAQRVLLQEAGYTSSDWVFLGDFINDVDRGFGRRYYFLARQAKPAGSEALPAVRLQTRQQVEDAVADGQIRELSWQAAISMALLRLFYLWGTNRWGLGLSPASAEPGLAPAR